MTIISVLRTKEGVYVGCDQQATKGNHPAKVISKIIKKNGYLIGVSGYCSYITYFRELFNPPSRIEDYSFTEYFFKQLLPYLREDLKSNRLVSESSNRLDTDSCFLFTDGVKVFEVSKLLDVFVHEEDVVCIGSGSDYAYGCLDTLLNHSKLSDFKMVSESVKCSVRFDVYCGGEPVVEFIRNNDVLE